MGILRTNEISGLETPTPVTGSVLFDGSGDYLTLAGSGDFELTGQFTIEYYLYLTSNSGENPVISWGNGSFKTIFSDSNGDWKLEYPSTGVVIGGKEILNTWVYYALTRDSDNNVRWFIDGKLQSTNSISSTIGSAETFYIGRKSNSSNHVNGYISNLRILKGTALYTSDFTVPVHELEVIGDTVLLCCNNPDSAAAASYAGIGTSKTITVNGDAAASTFSPGLTRDFTFGTQFEGVAKFDTQGYFVPPSGTTEQRFPNFGAVDASSARGIFFGGGYGAPTVYDVIDYVTISTTGNAQDFGNLTLERSTTGACSSLTRGVCAGGFSSPSFYNLMDYVTISSTGNAKDFGDLSGIRIHIGGCSNSIRGIFGGGWAPQKNVIEYITISNTGNTSDFGDLTIARFQPASFSSTTRGIFAGGTAPPSNLNNIDYITITSTGDAVDFGDLNNTASATGLSNSTRGLAVITNGSSDAIDFVTIASLGNATDFGNQTVSNRELSGSFASSIRGVIGGGSAASTGNVIDYVTIATTGNAQDFGDLIQQRHRLSGCSNGHGGLG